MQSNRTPPRPMLRFFSAVNVSVYRLSGGRLMAKQNGLPILLLTTRGRKSGKIYTKPLVYLKENDNYIIMPGVYERPAWLLNLIAQPQTKIEVGKQQIEVVAKELIGTERARIWQTVPKYWRDYQAQYSKPLAIMLLQALSQD